MNNQITKKICVVTGTRAEYGLLYWLQKSWIWLFFAADRLLG
jgi:hypothetical protein